MFSVNKHTQPHTQNCHDLRSELAFSLVVPETVPNTVNITFTDPWLCIGSLPSSGEGAQNVLAVKENLRPDNTRNTTTSILDPYTPRLSASGNNAGYTGGEGGCLSGGSNRRM